jgi:hypothetical protein
VKANRRQDVAVSTYTTSIRSFDSHGWTNGSEQAKKSDR